MKEVQYCKKCGNELNSDDRFCSKCGTKTVGHEKKKKTIVLVSCIVVLILGIVVFSISTINGNFNILSHITGQNKYDEEIETIKSLLVNKINSDNAEVMRNAEVNASNYTNIYKRQFKIDSTKARYTTLTEGILNAKFEENYKNRNIFYLTSKSTNGFEFIKISKWAVYESKIIVTSYKYDELYAYLENGEVRYGSDLTKLKEGIDKKDNFSKNPIYETYKNLLTTAKHNPNEYFVVDINNDDIEEIVLISEEGDYDYNTSIYAFINNEAFMVGETNSKDSIFYKMNEGYLKQVYLHGGYQEITHLYFEDTKFIVKTVSSRELTVEEEKNGNFETGDELIKIYNISNLEGLEILK